MKTKHWVAIVVALIGAAALIISAYIQKEKPITDPPTSSTSTHSSNIDDVPSSSNDENGDEESNLQDTTGNGTNGSSNAPNSGSTELGEGTTSNTSIVSNDSSVASTDSEFIDSSTGRPVNSVPVRDFLSSSVSSYIVDSTLTITVDKDCWVLIRDDLDFPYTWGIGLASSFDEVVGNYIIDIKISIDENYSVDTIKMATQKQLQEGVLIIDKMNNTCQAYFDGQQFIISCDITNDYIPLEELCIQSVYVYHDYE